MHELIEILQYTEDGTGQAFDWHKQKSLKIVARIINGVPIYLVDGFVAEIK